MNRLTLCSFFKQNIVFQPFFDTWLPASLTLQGLISMEKLSGFFQLHACLLQVMVKDLRKMYNTPASKSDFDEQIFPVLTCMTAYHSCLLTAKVTSADQLNA